MERIDDLINRLKDLRKSVKSESSRTAVEMAIYELENGFNPSDGIWIVKDNGRSLSKFAELSEVETLDALTLAKLENRRMAASRALSETIEATRQKMKNGGTWWTVAPHDIIDAVFRAVIKDDGKARF